MRKGFTLVEIMIVVAIIVLLAAIAIPNLLRARVNANQAAAIGGLHTVSTAAQSFRAAGTAYPLVLFSLSSTTPPYIDGTLGGGAKQGYTFLLSGATNTFSSTARPTTFQVTGEKGYFVDESGVMRWTALNNAPTVGDATVE